MSVFVRVIRFFWNFVRACIFWCRLLQILSFLFITRRKNWILSFGSDFGKLLKCIATMLHTSKFYKPLFGAKHSATVVSHKKSKNFNEFKLFFSFLLLNLTFLLQFWEVQNFFYSTFYHALLYCYEKKNLKKFAKNWAHFWFYNFFLKKTRKY